MPFAYDEFYPNSDTLKKVIVIMVNWTIVSRKIVPLTQVTATWTMTFFSCRAIPQFMLYKTNYSKQINLIELEKHPEITIDDRKETTNNLKQLQTSKSNGPSLKRKAYECVKLPATKEATFIWRNFTPTDFSYHPLKQTMHKMSTMYTMYTMHKMCTICIRCIRCIQIYASN